MGYRVTGSAKLPGIVYLGGWWLGDKGLRKVPAEPVGNFVARKCVLCIYIVTPVVIDIARGRHTLPARTLGGKRDEKKKRIGMMRQKLR